MGVSFQPLGVAGPGVPSECLLEVPFEAYTDSPNTNGRANEVKGNTTVRVKAIPRAQAGPRPRGWRLSLAGFLPSRFTTRRPADRGDALPILAEDPPRRQRSCRSCLGRWLMRGFLGFFIMLGIIQFISIACAIGLTFFPDEYGRAARSWMDPIADADADETTHWPTDLSREVFPVGCHSHNDYWRRIPLFSALQAGCIGVEADVWLFDEELYVGHTRSALTKRRTLRSLYVDPLVRILERQNPVTPFQRTPDQPPHGVFDTDPGQTLILLIDFKTDGAATWPAVITQLAPLRDRGYLTFFNGRDIIPGPVTVVGTGNTPFDLLTANATYRDVFFDAPLDKLVDDDGIDPVEIGTFVSRVTRSAGLGQGLSGMPERIDSHTFNITNSYYASVSFKKAVGFPWPFHFTPHQMDLIRSQVRNAHRHGLKVRYWGLPSWPTSLRNHIWRILLQEGVDMLNVDDLAAATKGDWKIKIFDWWF
ncbi:uncharacterized protein N7482_006711 [Penicillium canariense]|uniref:Altered inheritance of mitochondria protein 6 n=1 Tax=Penicillium canariense TaxID=189055 RepID=A0A9W9LIF1_9EURO|nr:uncharacterized protein N7482_006711 [Penicillium canariense]KAJ5159707.1 hypothetical protein N7482_006711 [Penicillium canariense]